MAVIHASNCCRISQLPEVIDYVKKSSLSEENCNEKAVSESTEKESSDELNKTLEAMMEPLKVLTLGSFKHCA